MYDDWELSEEELGSILVRVNNLLCLLSLQDRGYNIDDYYFGYCGCGECSNNDFLTTVIMIIFKIEESYKIGIELCEADDWVDGQPYRNGIKLPVNSDFVTEVIVIDPDADKTIASLVQYPDVLLVAAETNPAGEKYWRIALDTWDVEPYDLAEICILIQELKGAKVC